MTAITCSCGYEDIPENYHGIYRIEVNESQHVYIGCPKCGHKTFFQHFHIPLHEGIGSCGMSLSHLLAAPGDYSKNESQEYINYRIESLKLKPLIEIAKEGF